MYRGLQRFRTSGSSIVNRLTVPQLRRKASNSLSAIQDTYYSTKIHGGTDDTRSMEVEEYSFQLRMVVPGDRMRSKFLENPRYLDQSGGSSPTSLSASVVNSIEDLIEEPLQAMEGTYIQEDTRGDLNMRTLVNTGESDHRGGISIEDWEIEDAESLHIQEQQLLAVKERRSLHG
ncbi:hypothetical protein BC332_19056 [Capsicum chinense]|nr:hypothetical protein BC332_19056 [Capsicum chinense]